MKAFVWIVSNVTCMAIERRAAPQEPSQSMAAPEEMAKETAGEGRRWKATGDNEGDDVAINP